LFNLWPLIGGLKLKTTLESSLSCERLKELLTYAPDSGLFHWRFTRGPVVAGAVAGTIDKSGYVQIRIDGRFFRAHRLAWLYIHDSWPSLHIDHIDGDKSNNKIANLRNVCHQINQQNQSRAHKKSATGLMGVSRNGNRWMARIKLNGKTTYISNHETPEEAHEAYKASKRVLHPGCTL
jgi:hypothetical protein